MGERCHRIPVCRCGESLFVGLDAIVSSLSSLAVFRYWSGMSPNRPLDLRCTRSRASRCSLPSTPLNPRADPSLSYFRSLVSPPVSDSFTWLSGHWLRWFTLTWFPGVSDTLLHPTFFRRPPFHTIHSWDFALHAQIRPASPFGLTQAIAVALVQFLSSL